MALLKERMARDAEKRKQISEKVESSAIQLTKEEDAISKKIISIISDNFSEKMQKNDITILADEIREAIQDECEKLEISYESQKRIEKSVIATALGHGPIEPFLQDPDVTEIIVQRYDNIVIEKNGKIESVDAVFNNEEHLEIIIKRIVQRVGRQINLVTPCVDARLEDGSRINATFPPVSPDGATLCIRKFNNVVLSGRDYIKYGSIGKKGLYFLERAVRAKMCIFVSGGTGTGKTTFLNMLSTFISDEELIVTIEDCCELKLHQKNIRRLEARGLSTQNAMQVTIRSLVKNALRMRPDRIIVGEIRDGSIVDMLSAMSTGHEGSMSTGHANSPSNLVNVRMPLMFSMDEESNFTEKSQALQISEAIQIIVQLSRFPDGSRKVTHITHVCGIDKQDRVSLKDIYIYDREKKAFRFTGYYPKALVNIFHDKDMDFDDSIFSEGGVD